ncbi:MAG: MBL fold metallo-hydrolase [Lentisphaerae bacterium]|nr:MBL fold metallo-hydrolase [Lentisphaerota bacterium]
MQILSLPVGPFQSNAYIVADDDKRALVIDPGDDADAISGLLDDNGLTVLGYLLTHGHVDHVSALADLARKRPATVAIHRADESWAFTDRNQMPPFYGMPERPPCVDRILDDGQEWKDGSFTYRIISTPGHTPGSVCFYFESDEVLFTGDVLFAGSMGRTDLAGGDDAAMSRSLAKLAAFPDATIVYPGHGPQTAIGREKTSNMYLREFVS